MAGAPVAHNAGQFLFVFISAYRLLSWAFCGVEAEPAHGRVYSYLKHGNLPEPRRTRGIMGQRGDAQCA